MFFLLSLPRILLYLRIFFIMFMNYILIQLNGKPFNCLPSCSLKDILLYLDFDLDTIVVEYNSEVIHDSVLDTIVLVAGDKVEVLTIVGGG